MLIGCAYKLCNKIIRSAAGFKRYFYHPMKSRTLRACLIFCCLFGAAAANKALAQAVPDTATNNLIRSDSFARARRAPDTSAPRPAFNFQRALPERVAAVDTSKKIFQPVPKRAALFSAMLPGAGQLYNRQYWKVGLVYAGVGAATFFLIDNTTQYQKYRKAYVARLSDPNVQDEFTDRWPGGTAQVTANLNTLQSFYKRNLDLTYLLTGVGYALQVLDALAFSHLHNFDVSPNISLRLRPVSTPVGGAFGIVAILK